ncbi:MAG: hypothetical protein SGARI_003960, partial [Bacillariaceae sp.]
SLVCRLHPRNGMYSHTQVLFVLWYVTGFRVISSPQVEAGFRNVDRKFFVPKGEMDLAHKDQPVKEGNVHLSAPHIYGTVLEALELQNDSSISFLNAGSGSMYLTCIAASILGPRSVHYGVEIHKDVIKHSKVAIKKWKEAYPEAKKIQHMDVLHGNALELIPDKGECAMGFDRIYIGAAIESENLPLFKKILKPGGILVGPGMNIDDELVKIVRSEGTDDGDEYTTEVISAVRFAPLIPNPAIKTVIPARIWSPTEHQCYPESFRNACKEVLLCSNAKRNQPVVPLPPRQNVNAASMINQDLWMKVLSFTNRDWFETPQSELEYLRRRLREEKANAASANAAKLEAERKCEEAERERDVYRLLARRWKARVQASSGDAANDTETVEEAAAAMLLTGREHNMMFGIGNILRRLRTRAAAARREEDSSDDDDDDEEEASDRMEEDNDEDNDAEMSEDGDESSSDEDDESSMDSDDVQNAMDSRISKSLRSSQATARTVSISEEDEF